MARPVWTPTPVNRRLAGGEADVLDCIGFTERHRDTLAVLDMPVILSNAVVAKAVGELFGG
jgi:hypothetical protein